MNRWIIPIAITLALSGCTAPVLKDDTLRFGGDIRGNTYALARCTVSLLGNYEKLQNRAMDYEVRSYPDIETVELTGTEETTTITAEHFRLVLRQKGPQLVRAEITGMAEDTSALAWDYLTSCEKNGHVETHSTFPREHPRNYFNFRV